MAAKPWTRAIIVGASSGIGEALARELATSGCRVALVARRKAELDAIAADINASTPNRALTWAHDVTNYHEANSLFAEIVNELGGLDLIIYAAGIMPRLKPNEYDLDVDLATINTNLSGAVAWLNAAADRFGRTKSGTIIGISSVAGDRGRRGNVVYGATKAALNSYLESLRNRISVKGALVVTVKPGPISTPMTKGLKMPFMIPADQAASEILQAARNGIEVVYVPAKWKLIMRVVRTVPSFIFKHLNF
jgi:short-subunit dehydrogenase